MRKVLFFGLMTIALISFASINAIAGDGCPHSKTLKTSTQKAGCSASKGVTIESASAEATAQQIAKCCDYAGKCEMRTVSIKGMTGGGCEKDVSAALSEVPGVIKVARVCHKDGVAELCIDPTKVKDATLTKTVTNKGFKAEVIPAVANIAPIMHSTRAASLYQSCAAMDPTCCGSPET